MKAIYHFFTIVSVLLIMWMFISWVDVLMHNDPITGDYQYSQYNMINMFARGK